MIDGAVYAAGAGRPHLFDELSLEKELDNASAEALGHLLWVAEWDVTEIALLIKTSFQNDSVPV